jgi:DNA-binding transcriptional ArsR family regulator
MLTILLSPWWIPVGEWEEPTGEWPLSGGERELAGLEEEPLDGEWDSSGRGPAGASRETLETSVPQPGPSASPILGDAEILAAEALLDRRLLAVLLALGERPRQAGELSSRLRVLVKRVVRVKKKVPVRDPTGWGYKEVVREVEEERYEPRRLPESSLYRLLYRLRRAGLVEVYRGLDARRRYYRLTSLGGEVYTRIREHLTGTLAAIIILLVSAVTDGWAAAINDNPITSNIRRLNVFMFIHGTPF